MGLEGSRQQCEGDGRDNGLLEPDLTLPHLPWCIEKQRKDWG